MPENSPAARDAGAASSFAASSSSSSSSTSSLPSSSSPGTGPARKSRAAWAQLVRERLLHCWDQLVAADRAGYFAQPVAEVVDDEILAVYQRLIPRPMDLRTLQENIKGRSRYVRRPELFARDVELICANAQTFNVEGSPVFVEAEHLRSVAGPRTATVVRTLREKRPEFDAPTPGSASDSDPEPEGEAAQANGGGRRNGTSASPSMGSNAWEGQAMLVPVGSAHRRKRKAALGASGAAGSRKRAGGKNGTGRGSDLAVESSGRGSASCTCVVCHAPGTPVLLASMKRASLSSTAHTSYAVICWRCGLAAHLACANVVVRGTQWSDALRSRLDASWACQGCFRALMAEARAGVQPGLAERLRAGPVMRKRRRKRPRQVQQSGAKKSSPGNRKCNRSGSNGKRISAAGTPGKATVLVGTKPEHRPSGSVVARHESSPSTSSVTGAGVKASASASDSIEGGFAGSGGPAASATGTGTGAADQAQGGQNIAQEHPVDDEGQPSLKDAPDSSSSNNSSVRAKSSSKWEWEEYTEEVTDYFDSENSSSDAILNSNAPKVQESGAGAVSDPLQQDISGGAALMQLALYNTYFRLRFLEDAGKGTVAGRLKAESAETSGSQKLDPATVGPALQEFVRLAVRGEHHGAVRATTNIRKPRKNARRRGGGARVKVQDSRLFSLDAFNQRQISRYTSLAVEHGGGDRDASGAENDAESAEPVFDEDLVREEPFRGFQHGAFDDIWQTSPALVDSVILARMYSAGVTRGTTYRFAEKDDIESLARVNTVNPAYQEHLDYRFGIDRKNEFFLVAEREWSKGRHGHATKASRGSPKKKDQEGRKNKVIVGMCNYYFHWYRPPKTWVGGSSSSPTDGKGGEGAASSGRSRRGSFDSTAVSRSSSPASVQGGGSRSTSPGVPSDHRSAKARKIMYVATLQATKPSDATEDSPMVSEPRTGVALLCLAIQHARAFGCSTLFLDATSDSISFYQRFFGLRRLPAREGYEYNPMVLYLDDGTWDPGVPLGLAAAKRVESVVSVDGREVGANSNRQQPTNKRARRSRNPPAESQTESGPAKHSIPTGIKEEASPIRPLVVSGTGISPGATLRRHAAHSGSGFSFSVQCAYGTKRAVLSRLSEQRWVLPRTGGTPGGAMQSSSAGMEVLGVADVTRGAPERAEWGRILSLQRKLHRLAAQNTKRTELLSKMIVETSDTSACIGQGATTAEDDGSAKDPAKKTPSDADSLGFAVRSAGLTVEKLVHVSGEEADAITTSDVGVCRLCGIASLVHHGDSNALDDESAGSGSNTPKLLCQSRLVKGGQLRGFVHPACAQFAISTRMEAAVQAKEQRQMAVAAAAEFEKKELLAEKRERQRKARLAKKRLERGGGTAKVSKERKSKRSAASAPAPAPAPPPPPQEYCVCGVTDVAPGHHPKTKAVVTEPFVACDGGCDRWFHPGCIGFSRCTEHGASRCLINLDGGGGHENITRSFICPSCREAQPFRVIPHWPTPGQHYGTSTRLLGPKIPVLTAAGAEGSDSPGSGGLSKRGRRRSRVNYAEMAGMSPTSSLEALMASAEEQPANTGLVSHLRSSSTTPRVGSGKSGRVRGRSRSQSMSSVGGGSSPRIVVSPPPSLNDPMDKNAATLDGEAVPVAASVKPSNGCAATNAI